MPEAAARAVTQDLVGNPETIKKVTEHWELSDNLGTWHGQTSRRRATADYACCEVGDMDQQPCRLGYAESSMSGYELPMCFITIATCWMGATKRGVKVRA
jgi:hypothetical protein